jgi:hypothetical protein
MRHPRCKNCHELIALDGYGEPVHVETNLYGCESGETVAE